MSKGYTTKFNIGDTVWFVKEETKYQGICSCCNSRLCDVKVKTISRSTVTEIFISKNLESYNLKSPRSLPSNKLFSTEEEAMLSLKSN